MARDVSKEEVKRVLFSMPNNKSPGPNGYTSELFKAPWPIIGNDFTIAIKVFFSKGFVPKGLNSTILALITKKGVVEKIKDYR